MGKASSNKKVARAASTGGGRTARGRRPWIWYGTLSLFVVLGIGVIAQSRGDYIDGRTAGVPPRLNPGGDHWHVAYGIYICDEFIPGLTDKNGDEVGIHSHGDGLIHIHPSSKRASGANAKLGRFLDEVGADVTQTKIEVPGRKVENGDKCGKQKGEVVVKLWESAADTEGKLIKGDPADMRFRQDGAIVTMAFVPEGTEVPKPPSVANLASPSDLPQSNVPPAQTPPSGDPTAPPEGESTPPPDPEGESTPPSEAPASTTPE